MMLFATLFFVVNMFLLLSNSVEAADNVRCLEIERRALLEFKAGVVDEHGILSSWRNNSNECCNWRGIRCSNRTGHVTLLNLSGNPYSDTWFPLSGKVSPSLSELKHLKYLNLSYNDFYGEIPPQLGNLTNLHSLDLLSNEFNGKIPHQLGNLTNLHSLDLRSNEFNGEIPPQLGNLTNLRFLDLGSVNLLVQNLDWVSRLQLLTHLDLSGVNLSSCNNWLNQIYKLSSLTHLHLRFCRLPGPLLPLINTSFPAFNSLVVADLSWNFFISPKSYNWLFNFTTLVSLDLSDYSYPRREIPEAIGRLISLESLALFNSELEGTLPDSFRNLSRLATLYLGGNNFNGSLSEFLRPLATREKNSLQVLMLGQNQLDGSLPDYFPRFPYLRKLRISNNKLSGPFPINFWQVHSSLIDLDLSHNQITGQLPNRTLFSSLETLRLRNNKLEGTIPETYLSNLAKLILLDLSYNSFSLKISVYWVPPFQLTQLYLHNCTLGPHFPNWLQSQRKISGLSISSAGISDTIPLWFWDILPSVDYLNISHNNIQGTLPNISFTSLSRLGNIDMSYNNLSGPIPQLPASIWTLDLSQNMFTGSLPFLCTSSYKRLNLFRVSDNQLSGELPDCWINVQGLWELNLANNSFSGKLPASIGLLNKVQILQLRNNSLSRELPSSLMNCSKLRLLDLSENEFTGEVPTWIGTHLTDLIVFSLGKNKFFGRIPRQICLLTYVQVLDLSRNNFSGGIPNCVNNFRALVQREDYNISNDFTFLIGVGDNIFTSLPNAYVQWKGQKSSYGHTLLLLKLIDFSRNTLVGDIPEEFASLKELMSLNLSNNNLNGHIIPNIGQMNNLEVLDLSENNLSGEIPGSLSNLNFLSVLDLSKNRLRGRIPSSTQLQSFDPSSYAGNDKLCGLPLPDNCTNNVKNVSSQNDDEHGDTFLTIGFYISLVLGFFTGFWGFLGPVILRSPWRRAYLRLLENLTDWIYVTTSVCLARLQRKIYG